MCAEFIRDSRGFTLLEVLIASSILVVGIVSLAQLLAMEVAANGDAGQMTFATLVAAQKIEDLRAATWESLSGSAGDFVDYPDRAGTSTARAASPAGFTRRWSISPWSADPNNTLVIQVVVRTSRGEVGIVDVRTRATP